MVLPVCWVEGGPGVWWDQAFLEALLAGQLHPVARAPTLDPILGLDSLPESLEGAVFIVPGQHALGQVDALTRRLEAVSWALVIIGGDEEALYPTETLRHPNMRLWIQTPRPGRHDAADRYLPVGWTPQTPRLLPEFAAEAQVRPLDFFFSGQTPEDHPPRLACVEALYRLTDTYRGEIHPTQRFAEQYEGETPDDRARAYLRRLASAKLAPAPCGPVTPDTFRCWEALEAGCLPIVNATAPYAKDVTGYWSYLLGESPPFPILDEWGELPALMPTLISDWLARANEVSAWWQWRKRSMSYWIIDDLAALQQTTPDIGGLTVLIPTSPIPSHPDTSIICETIASITERLPDSEVILMIDGVRSEQADMRSAYEEYVRRLLWLCEHEWRNVVPFRFATHEHQARMTRTALDHVRTPCVLFVEHDTPLRGEIDFDGITRAITNDEARIVRLHHSTDIYKEHRHMMIDMTPQQVAGVPMLRTWQWSQRPHVASTSLYRQILNDYFNRDERWMIEDRMHSIISNAWQADGIAGWNAYKLWIYAPPGSLERSYHLDGRAGAPKWTDS